ncbi:MAG: hypothetical protein ABW167_03385, partial [Baekduia sp.]
MRRVLSTTVLGVALLTSAPAAKATDITNPAKNPAPITLTIDGQTYRDGADTLPGYDDYACTPIPNVEYDFGDDQIQYYDGQGELVTTAHWTEWSRISSYEAWVAQQQQGKAPSPSTSPTTSSANASPTTTSTTTTSPTAAAPAATSPTTTSSVSKPTVSTTKGSATKTQRSATETQRSATKTESSATKNKTNSASRQSKTSTTPKVTPSHAKQLGTTAAAPTKRNKATKRSGAATPTADDALAD